MARYDPATALLIVDLQNDFADPSGSLYVPGGEALPRFLNREIARAAAAGAPVVYTQDWHPPITPHFKKDGGIWPVHCVAGSWGADFHPDLERRGELVIRKGTGGEDGYSAFAVRDPDSGATAATPLAALLAERGVRRLVVAGLATDYCVKETVLDARRLGFPVTVLRDGIAAVNLAPGDGERALAEMAAAGAVLE
ncbi:MAG: isochorismatase family protein [Pseudomonadota bacterium]